MELNNLTYRHPEYVGYCLGISIVVLVLIIGFRIWKSRKTIGNKEKNKTWGYGAMWMIREMPGYKFRKIKYYVCCVMALVGVIMTIVGSAQLMARPSYTSKITTGVKRRDIFLCLDVSYSLYGLNYDFAENLKSLVQGLDGDRIGITMYNTTSVLYLPMTEDKDFAIERLDEMEQYFINQKKLEEDYADVDYYSMSDEEFDKYLELADSLQLFQAGTLTNSSEKGSSLIGEGLASCLYSFPYLEDDDRTRVIIMVTDNAENALKKPTVELKEAAGLCVKNNVTVFGVFPPEEEFDLLGEDYDYEQLKNEMKSAVESTGGAFYVAGSDFDTSSIVKSIQQHEAMQVDEISMTKVTDVPTTSFVICFIGIVLVAVAKGGGI